MRCCCYLKTRLLFIYQAYYTYLFSHFYTGFPHMHIWNVIKKTAQLLPCSQDKSRLVTDIFQVSYTLSSTTYFCTFLCSRHFAGHGVGSIYAGISMRCCSVKPIVDTGMAYNINFQLFYAFFISKVNFLLMSIPSLQKQE